MRYFDWKNIYIYIKKKKGKDKKKTSREEPNVSQRHGAVNVLSTNGLPPLGLLPNG